MKTLIKENSNILNSIHFLNTAFVDSILCNFLKGKNKINLYSQILMALHGNLRGSVLKTGPDRWGNIKLMTEADNFSESRTKNDQFVPATPGYSHLEMNVYNNKRWGKSIKTYKLRCGYIDVGVVVTNPSCILCHSKK